MQSTPFKSIVWISPRTVNRLKAFITRTETAANTIQSNGEKIIIPLIILRANSKKTWWQCKTLYECYDTLHYL